MNNRLILLTGATGYVGGRLLTRLLEQGYRVRCLARQADHLRHRVRAGVEVVSGDVTDAASLAPALSGVDAAFYLVHSMGDGSEFEAREALGATCFASAALAAGVRRIVYLGGLGDEQSDLSPHLRSRQQVGRILRESGVPTVELRASVVIGSGSLSFELVRALTEHLPIMITPRWVSVMAQPIGIQDLLAYLTAALEVPLTKSVVVEIGGADQVSYLEMMREYARQRGLRRVMVRVPLLTPRLSSLWLGLVTPVYARVGRKLVESIRHPTVVTTDVAARMFAIRPAGLAESMRAAMANEDREYAETRWSDAVSSAGTLTGAAPSGGLRLMDRREIRVEATPERCFEVVSSLGGRTGWPPYTWLWRVRGFIDMVLGGVGMRRGRPVGRALGAGDALDFWRVERCEPGARLRLAAEMKVPGRAWLEFEVVPAGGAAIVRQTATFDPAGLAGRIYWYALVPVHALVFSGTLRSIARRAART